MQPLLLPQRLKGLLARRPGLAVCLWGEPGVGKSHAAAGLLRALPCRSLAVGAVSSQVLARALPRPDRLPAWVPAAMARLERGEGLEPERAADALAATLAALAPFVLLVEDLHEAGPDLELWTMLAGAVARSRGVGLLATSRTEPPPPFEGARVERLSRAGSDALLEGEAGAALRAAARAWVYERARGNPLFTLEFFRFLARRGELWSDGRSWRWREPEVGAGMPATVEALIARGLAAVEPAAEAALAALALLPDGASPDLVAVVAGLEPIGLERAERALERAGVRRGGGFAHPLFREVARAELPAARRRELARRAVAALEGPDPEGAAAFLSEAGLPPDEALGRLEAAAGHAERRGDPGAAARLLGSAAELARGPARARLALAAARGLAPLDLPAAAVLAELAHAADPADPDAALTLAELLARLGETERAERLAATTVAGLAPGSQAALLGLPRWLSVRLENRDYAGVLELWNAQADPRSLGLDAALGASFARGALGDLPGALATLEAELNRDPPPPERARLLERRGLLLLNGQAAHRAAEADYEVALPLLEALGEPRRLAIALHNLAYARWYAARHREAAADLERALALAAASGDGRDHADHLAFLGVVRLELGDFERAEEHLGEARVAMVRLGSSAEHLAILEVNLAYLHLERGSPHAAALAPRHAAAGLWLAREVGSPLILSQALFFAAWAEARHGSADRALELAGESLALAEQIGQRRGLALGRFGRAFALEALGRREEALGEARGAAAIMTELELPYWAERLGLEADRLSGDSASARRRLEFFEARGLGAGAAVARRYFPDLAAVAPAPPLAMRLLALGPLALGRDGSERPVRGAQARVLLARLLVARLEGRAGVGALELADGLYGSDPEKRALAALQQLVARLRSSLGAEIVRTTADGYALGAVASDAEAFLAGGPTTLWRGPALPDLADGGGLEPTRGALQAALLGRARGLLEGGAASATEAARLGRLLVEAEPYDRAALALALRALRAGGNRRGALALYAAARARFLEVGERLPEAESEFLAETA